MIKIESIESLSELSELKQAYFEQATAPLDGMWHFGFAPIAKHFGFYFNGHLVGFCCINEEAYMLQFYLQPDYQIHSQQLFTLISEQNSSVIGNVKGAFVSTAEPHYLSLCLDNSSEFKVNALMYQQANGADDKANKNVELQLATSEQLAEFVKFTAANIGAPEQWLNSYYGDLIARHGLFGYWNDMQLLAAGECRLFDHYQTEYADLGVIVSQLERGQGIAKGVLTVLVQYAANKGLTAMCSTESDNIAAQKAISSVGFISNNRIVQFEFKHS
jgi:predicted acetyltransferase